MLVIQPKYNQYTKLKLIELKSKTSYSIVTE